ncbi:MAG: hypothetical protein LH467_06730, partial [Gemmatimonadaceae bacterium]|nr:hypothetical protein [Gemmatimonadaceae bacterium]
SAGWEGNVQYLGNGFWYSDDFCPKYTGTANLEPGQNYTNLLLAVGPGITNVAAVRCSLQYNPYGYEMIAFESDGGLNGSGDDFGRRFFYGGSIPFGAAVGYQLPYYSGGGTPSDGQLSVEMTLQYR